MIAKEKFRYITIWSITFLCASRHWSRSRAHSRVLTRFRTNEKPLLVSTSITLLDFIVRNKEIHFILYCFFIILCLDIVYVYFYLFIYKYYFCSYITHLYFYCTRRKESFYLYCYFLVWLCFLIKVIFNFGYSFCIEITYLHFYCTKQRYSF